MEKADILDLTVSYLRSTLGARRQQDATTGLASYQAGFRDCQDHMTRVLISDETLNTEKKTQIISHIANTRPIMALPMPQTIHCVPNVSTSCRQLCPTQTPSTSTNVPVLSKAEGLKLHPPTATATASAHSSNSQNSSTSETTWKAWRPW